MTVVHMYKRQACDVCAVHGEIIVRVDRALLTFWVDRKVAMAVGLGIIGEIH